MDLRHKRRLRLGVWVSLTLGALGALFFLYRVRAILAPFLLAVFLAYLLEPAVTGLSRRGWSRVAAILVMYLVVGGTLATTLVFVLPAFMGELLRLADSLPSYVLALRELVLKLQDGYQRVAVPLGLRTAIDEVILRVQAGLEGQIRNAAQAVFGLARTFVGLLIAPLLAFYLLKDSALIKSRFTAAVPPLLRRDFLDLANRLDLVASGFVRGQLLVASTVGLMAGLAAWLLGLRYGVMIGVVAGLADVIPYFGPVIGAVPAIALALAISPLRALELILVFALIQQLENSVVGPLLIGDRVGLHPLVVIFAVLAGGALAGVTGMLLAVPLAGIVRVLWCFGWEKVLDWRDGLEEGSLAAPGRAALTTPGTTDILKTKIVTGRRRETTGRNPSGGEAAPESGRQE